MTTLLRLSRTLTLTAVGMLAAGVSHAQATWDLDACTGGTKAASGYTSCGTGNVAHGTVNIKAYSATAAGAMFTTASTSINNGGSYLGVWSGTENSGASGSTSSPHHAIDNFTGFGSAYELVHLQFTKAVDLTQLVAEWANSTSTGDADFQLYRWDYNAGTPNPTITSFSPNAMTGWTLAAANDFDSSPGSGGSAPAGAGLTQNVSDGSYYSSHWLVATAFGGGNDAFKLGTLSANVCAQSQQPGGTCGSSPGGTPTPEPASLALLGIAAFGAAAARRRQQAKRA